MTIHPSFICGTYGREGCLIHSSIVYCCWTAAVTAAMDTYVPDATTRGACRAGLSGFDHLSIKNALTPSPQPRSTNTARASARCVSGVYMSMAVLLKLSSSNNQKLIHECGGMLSTIRIADDGQLFFSCRCTRITHVSQAGGYCPSSSVTEA